MSLGSWGSRVVAGAGTVLAWGALGVGAAFGDVEPNGAVLMAEGPIAGGQDIQGTLDGGDRDDWYVFHVEEPHQLHLTGGQALPGKTPTNPVGPQPLSIASCVTVELTNANGTPIPRDFTSADGPSTFYVHAYIPSYLPCGTTPYGFRVDPAEAIVTGPGKLPVKGTAEPNDTRADAGGPLVPNAWYHSELETANDSDWLRFYVKPGNRRVDVQAVTYGSACPTHRVVLRGARGADLGGYVGSDPTIKHLVHRQRGGARLYVEIRNDRTSVDGASCVRSATVVQVGPESAIMSAAEAKEACADGRAAKRRAKRAVRNDRGALAHAKARGRATGALRRKLKRDRRALRRSSRRVATYCSR